MKLGSPADCVGVRRGHGRCDASDDLPGFPPFCVLACLICICAGIGSYVYIYIYIYIHIHSIHSVVICFLTQFMFIVGFLALLLEAFCGK